MKKVLIIGGGMAGLSAGAYLRMNGYETDIYELNQVAGGVCTGWKRGDYNVDLCIHWLIGAGPASSLYRKWNELVDMEDIQVQFYEEYGRVEDKMGRQLVLYTDPDKLEAELLEKAPEDREKILEMTHAIRKLALLDIPHDQADELNNIWDRARGLLQMAPFMGVYNRFLNISLREYTREFKNPLLQKAIYHLFEPEMAAIFPLLSLAWMGNKSAGYPVGGSMRFAQQVLNRYLALGGRIHFNSRVVKILTEEDRAVGIELASGEKYFADYVVSAADGHNTLYDMLDGKYLTPRLDKFYRSRKTFPSLIYIALGVARGFDGEPSNLLFPMERTLVIDPDTIIDEVPVRIHNFDQTLAAEGKTLVTVSIETENYPYWQELHQNQPAKYQTEKMRIAAAIIKELDRRLGNIADKVDMIDITTPAMIINFSNNWKGALKGWELTPETGQEPLPHALPKLDNFYMCGQWVVVGGGLPAVMLSGRDVAQLICHQDDVPFQVQEVAKSLEQAER